MGNDSFRSVSQYLSALPRGIDSYPDCLAHRSVVESVVRDHTSVATLPGLPIAVRQLFVDPRRQTWVSEVAFQAASLAVRDAVFQNDDTFVQWTVRWATEVLDQPVLRHLMRLVSPTLVVSGAAKRWKAVHLGSTLTSELLEANGAEARALLRLAYPERLFPGPFLTALCGVFEVAVTNARGRSASVSLLSTADTHSEFQASWVS